MPEKNSWVRFFDAHAPINDESVFVQDTAQEVEFLLDKLKPPPRGSILDVGCGTGRHAISLARR